MKNEKEIIENSHRRRKRQENVLNYSIISLFFFVCATIINELPVISCFFLFFDRTLPAASMRPPGLIYLSTSTGVRTGCHFLVSVYVCVTVVVFTDCESCTRPISTNPGSMEAGEYGLTLGTCFLACRLELDVVTGLLWIS